MCHVHPTSWDDFFRIRDFFQNHSQKGPPSDLAMFFSYSPRPWCLSSGLRLGVFSVPGICVDTYVYDDVYVRVLMTSYLRTSDHRVRKPYIGSLGPK